MNWSYVAGFFDGEGNICICGNVARRAGQYGATFAQSGRLGLRVLTEIRLFLETEGIASYICKQERLYAQTMYTLRVSGRKHLLPFLQKLHPYLHVKRTSAQDAIRFLRLYPDTKGLFFSELNRRRKATGWYEVRRK